MMAIANAMRRVKLKDVCSRITVGHVGSMAKRYTTEGIPFLRSQNIRPFRLSLNEIKFIAPDFHEKLRKSALHPGDVAVVRTGYPGTACVIPDKFTELNCSDLVVITPSTELNPYFLAALFNSVWGMATVSGKLVGAAQQHFNIGAAREMEVMLPSRPLQDRIVDILSAYDELMENSHRRIQILEAMVHTLYREWFVDGRFPGHEGSPLGDVPKGWEGRFGSLASIERDGINPFGFPDESFEHFSIPAFDDGRTPSIELGETILSGKYSISGSCVLLSKLNPRIPRVWLPRPSGQRRSITSTEFVVLAPRAGVTREFIYAKCTSDEFASQFGSLAIGTSTSHQRVKPDNLLAMPSSVPDHQTIERFTSIAAPMLGASERLREQIHNLRRTRDLILPRLLSGDITVPSANS
jgi:type I restriction enzyme S subunit